jgi:hypothetical protein
MLLITGFPGFVAKIYAVNHKNGYWQGMYQWQSPQFLNDYKRSLVFRIMNKRACADSLHEQVLPKTTLNEFLNRN